MTTSVRWRPTSSPAPSTLHHPNERWSTDITYVWTWEGWLYLAVVLDLFSRRVVGWAIQPHLRVELALEALHMALGRRVPEAGLLHHSDRGCQYAADAYQRVLRDHGIVCSMSRKGDCWDNAITERFFATLKTELIHRQPWPTRRGAKDAVAEYIEGFYNPYRLHSSLGYVSPIPGERRHARQAQRAANNLSHFSRQDQVCGSNLRLLMRRLTGVGTPRSLKGRGWTLIDALLNAFSRFWSFVPSHWTAGSSDPAWTDPTRPPRPPRTPQPTRRRFCDRQLALDALAYA